MESERMALENQEVVLPPPPPLCRRPTHPGRWLDKLPRGVVNFRHGVEPISLDLICSTCEEDIPKSKPFNFLCHFYSPVEHAPESESSIQNENYPDAVLGSPNDFDPRLVRANYQYFGRYLFREDGVVLYTPPS